jgi:hypothetical protein
MKELDALLHLSGHNCKDSPHTSDSVLTVLDTDIATWPTSKLREAHSKHKIHIVPLEPVSQLFTQETCVRLGINIDQPREVHGKSFTPVRHGSNF